ncbi:hypothetical protein DDE18_17920 [Nocardioides gansuensis]|uniref:DUF2142 domain-containing protein n=1 Tax=Nocardioides gansuensis TaxID=2138300 RepID=A0A2T8F6N2_9ACTN|nr:DUF2142 domain-containing protein [Nocardioides gansuensis]PVG81366.1 hypothetical protein DDE18_17920 [Nocardioides gansuensis]
MTAPTTEAPGLRRRVRLETLGLFLVGAALLTLWSLATPQWSSPDAPSHETMAYSVGHGELWPERSDEFGSGVTSNAIVVVPQGILDSAASAGCTAFQMDVPASCLAPIGPSEKPGEMLNPAGRNIPTYYLVTGWPSTLVPVEWSMAANRAAAISVAALFLALGLGAAMRVRQRGLALAGCAVSLTPMALYLGGVLNPNSGEIFAAFAMAATSLAAVKVNDPWLSRVLARRAMLAASFMVAVRMLAPGWLAIWVAALVVALGWPAFRRLAQHAGRWVWAPVVAVVAQALWTILSGVRDTQTTPQFDLSLLQRLELAREHIGADVMRQQVGTFGWLDTLMPDDAYLRYLTGAALILSVLWLRLTPRTLIALLALALAVYSAPIALEALQWNANGPVWQGRYTLPLTVMLPVLAALGPERAPGLARPSGNAVALVGLGLVLLASAHIEGFYTLLRRNTSGITGDAFDGPWESFATNELTFAALVLSMLVALAALFVAVATDGRVPLRRMQPAPAERPAVHDRPTLEQH